MNGVGRRPGAYHVNEERHREHLAVVPVDAFEVRLTRVAETISAEAMQAEEALGQLRRDVPVPDANPRGIGRGRNCSSPSLSASFASPRPSPDASGHTESLLE